MVTTHNPGPGAHAAEIAGVEVTPLFYIYVTYINPGPGAHAAEIAGVEVTPLFYYSILT